MSEFDEARRRDERLRRESAAERAAERAENGSPAPTSLSSPWRGPGGTVIVWAVSAALFASAAVVATATLGFSIPAALFAIAAVSSGVATARAARRGPGRASDGRLQSAFDSAMKAIDAGDLDPERSAELAVQLREARDEVDRLSSLGAPEEVVEERVAEFETQAARLREVAHRLGGGRVEASSSLDAAIGDLQEEATARAELDEALTVAGEAQSASETGLLE